jgi:ComF family protein
MVAGRPAWLDTIDLVVPVPLHPKRQRQRGFNQSALLSRYLCRSLNLVLSENALRRIRHTTPQIELGPEERASNVRGAFAAVPRQVAGRHILLVDDVFTTGATLSAAAEALLAAGARVVSGYCLASVG